MNQPAESSADSPRPFPGGPHSHDSADSAAHAEGGGTGRVANGLRDGPPGDPHEHTDQAAREGAPDAAEARLRRLSTLVEALDDLARRLRDAETAEAVSRALGEALRAVGMESAVCLLDHPVDLREEGAGPTLEAAVAHARSLSLGPARLRSLERLLGRRASAIPLPLGRISGLAESARASRPLFLPQIEQPLREALPWLPAAATSQARRLLRAESAILAPLACHGRVAGFLAVWALDLGEQDAAVIGACALQAGAAFENVWLTLDAARRERRLAALSEIGTDVAGTVGVEEVFERVVARAAEALGVDHIGLWLRDSAAMASTAAPAETRQVQSEPGVARLVAQRGLSPLHQHLGAALSTTSAPFAGNGLGGSRRGRATICPDIAQTTDEELPRRGRLALLEQGYRSFVAAPVLTPGNETIGALIAYSIQPRAFQREDGTYLEAIGRHAAVAIEQGQLFHALESGRALLAAVFDADPAGIAVLEGEEHRVRVANPRLRALSVEPEADPIGQPIRALFPDERTSLPEGLDAVLNGVRATRRPIALRGVELRDAASETQRVVTVNVAPIHLRQPGEGAAQDGAQDDALLLILWDSTAHVRAEARLAAQVHRAETLATVATALEREGHLPDLLRRIARAAQELTGADAAAFVLRETPARRFRAVALLGPNVREQSPLDRAPVPDLRVLRPLLREGHTLLSEDAARSSPPAEARLLRRAGVAALAGAPVLASEGWVMGGLVVGHRTRGHFSIEHTELLRALAAQATAAIQRTRALEAARRQADELEAVFGGLAEGVAIYDAAGALVRMNPAAVRILRQHGHDRAAGERALRGPALRAGDGTPLPDDQTPGARAVRGDAFTDAEYLHVDAEGGQTLLSASGAPLVGAEGASNGGVVAFRDVTEVRRLERRTREALDALLQVAGVLVAPVTPPEEAVPFAAQPHDAASARDQALDALLGQFCQLIINVLGCERASINLVNPETHVIAPGVIVGLAPEEEMRWRAGQATWFGASMLRLEDRLHPQQRDRFLRGETVTLHIRRPPYFNPANPRGTVIIVPLMIEREVVGAMMFDARPHGRHPGGREYGADELALAQGVARLAALAVQQQRLRRLATEVEALRAANALKEEFLSIASHELKTPLTVLQARAQSTQRRLTRQGLEEAAALFGPVQSSLDRMVALIHELLDASRIAAGKLELHQEPRHLGAMAREAVQEARDRSDLAIELHGADAPNLWVEVDPERAMQVLTNLLDNAVKYSPPGGKVVVRLERRARTAPPSTEQMLGLAADEVVVTVSDQGVGIPPDEVEHVFERFYRARTSSVRQYGGLGLGLHIAATIVERHGGRVWAESPGAGLGSTFGLALPAV